MSSETLTPTPRKRRGKTWLAAAAVPLVLGATLAAAVPANAAPTATDSPAGKVSVVNGQQRITLAWEMGDGQSGGWPQKLAPGGVVPAKGCAHYQIDTWAYNTPEEIATMNNLIAYGWLDGTVPQTTILDYTYTILDDSCLPGTLKTTATDKADGDKTLSFRGGVIKDVVEYTGLTPGVQYALDGDLVYQAGAGVYSPTGSTPSKTFTPTTADGTVEMDFTVPVGYVGKPLVAYEKITNIATGDTMKEWDNISVDQTVRVEAGPSIKATDALDKADGDQTVSYRGGVVRDVVQYAGLTPGVEYTVNGEQMDKATGKSAGIKGSTTFTPTAADGTVDVNFTVPVGFANKDLVSFEEMSDAKGVVAFHKDIKAGAQTVHVQDGPSVNTNATDKADGDKTLPSGGGVVGDVVQYKGLTPGVEYTVNGEEMDKATGKATGIKASKTFTPTAADGSVEIDFTVPAGFADKDLVAFQEVSDAQGAVAAHKDINAATQTVHVDAAPAPAPVTITTKAVDGADGDQLLPKVGGTVVDTVTYTGLKPGTEYTVNGELHNKADGAGTGVKGTTTFTPTAADGRVQVTFKVPGTLSGKALVAFESISQGTTVLASEADINQAAQTVTVAENPAGPILNPWVGGGLAGMMLLGAGGVLARRKRLADAE